MSFPFNTVVPSNYSSANLDGQATWSVNLHSPYDYGFFETQYAPTQAELEELFELSTEFASYERFSDDTVLWDASAISSMGLNVPGWYVASTVEDVGDTTGIFGEKKYTFGPMYDGATLINPSTATHLCAASGGNYGEHRHGYFRAFACKITNTGEKGGHAYDVFFVDKAVWHRSSVEDVVRYNYYGGFCLFPAHEMGDLDFEEDVPPGPDPDDPNEDDPESTTGEDGGDGNHTPDYDPIPVPPLPTLGSATSGFLTMYKLGAVQMYNFAQDMFASDIWEAIKLFFSNPMDFLVGCMLLPFEPPTGSSYYPKFGIKKFAHAYPAVSNQYKTIECGSVQVSKYWGSAFDFEPFTKLQIWLPYIGYRDLPVDEIMDTTIGVTYHVDCLTGDCVAFVHRGVVGETGPQIPRVIGQFYGNCGVRVPFGSVSFDAAIAAGINLIGAAASQGLSVGAAASDAEHSGNEFNGQAEMLRMASHLTGATMNVVTSMKPNVQKGGAAGASTGYMSIQKPYLIRRIPRQNLPDGYKDFKGYPANIRSTLGELGGGYAEVDDIQLNNIPAFEDERREIMQWLRGGVLI